MRELAKGNKNDMRLIPLTFVLFLACPSILGWSNVEEESNEQTPAQQRSAMSPLEFLSERGGMHELDSGIQFSVTMTSTHTNVRTLQVQLYNNWASGDGHCDGTLLATANMTAVADETFTSGVTYTANSAASWAMVNVSPNSASSWYFNGGCLQYKFLDSGGSPLAFVYCHSVKYTSAGSSVCNSGACGQSAACTLTW